MKAHGALLVAATLMVGCGSEDQASHAQVPSGGQDVQVAAASIEAALPTTPINLDDAVKRTPPTVTQPGPCPFLSDATAVATAKAHSGQPLTRKRVSNTECIWNFNSGFAVNVRIEPVDSAKPMSERRYNIGSDPILVEQDGPGNNAMILQDDTWGKARPYAFGFEIDGKSVLLKITGLHTTPEQLRATADEIASTLPSAPVVEESTIQSVAAFDQCTVWDTPGILSLFDYAADDTVSERSNGIGCTYKLSTNRQDFPGPEVSTQFTPMEESIFEQVQSKPDAQRLSNYDIPVVQWIETSEFGIYTNLLAFVGADRGAVRVSIRDRSEARESEARKLLDNLLARVQ